MKNYFSLFTIGSYRDLNLNAFVIMVVHESEFIDDFNFEVNILHHQGQNLKDFNHNYLVCTFLAYDFALIHLLL